jgi:hypothetical protein
VRLLEASPGCVIPGYNFQQASLSKTTSHSNMKSFMAMLPLAGLALAQGQCAPGITITETSIEKITVTVQPATQVAPSAIVTPNTEGTKPSSTPQVPYYPIGNTTVNGTSNFPTHTPHAPTTLETFIFPTSDVVSSSAPSKKVKPVLVVPSKKIKTIIVAPSPVVASSASQAAAAATSSLAAAPAQSSQAVAVPDTASEEATSSSASVTGTASFYGGNTAGGACSFSGYTIPSNLFGTAFGGSWDASQCGACVEVTNKAGKSIKAMVRMPRALLAT